jgi:hypothetical protein
MRLIDCKLGDAIQLEEIGDHSGDYCLYKYYIGIDLTVGGYWKRPMAPHHETEGVLLVSWKKLTGFWPLKERVDRSAPRDFFAPNILSYGDYGYYFNPRTFCRKANQIFVPEQICFECKFSAPHMKPNFNDKYICDFCRVILNLQQLGNAR